MTGHPSEGSRWAKPPERITARRAREQSHIDLLDEVRIDLWADLAVALSVNPMSMDSESLVRRIRVIGRHLGRATSMQHVPIPWLLWYERIEHVPEWYLHPEPVLTADKDRWAEQGHELHLVNEDAIELYGRSISMIDDEGDDDEP